MCLCLRLFFLFIFIAVLISPNLLRCLTEWKKFGFFDRNRLSVVKSYTNSTRILLSLFSVSSFYDWLANDFGDRSSTHTRIFSHWRLSCRCCPLHSKTDWKREKTSKPKRRLIVNFQFKIESILCVCCATYYKCENIWFISYAALPFRFDSISLALFFYWVIDVYQFEEISNHISVLSAISIRNNLHYHKSALPSEMTAE